MTAQARIPVAVSFIVISVIGAGLIYLFWANQSVVVATGRAALFVGIMACVHVAGYVLYVQQDYATAVESLAQRSQFELSLLYWPALKNAILIQSVVGVIAALVLDLGESLGFFQVAFLAHWIGILIIIAR